MGLVNPAIAVAVSIAFLIALLYKRVNLGIVLNATALLLALLAIDLVNIPKIIHETSTNLHTISVVVATFGIMFLSQLYKETSLINKLSESLSAIINNPKIVLSVLPAVIGLLPVAGGALMSAPLVDKEAEKLKLKADKKAYVNLWFRHTIFPVYPLSPPIITTAMLTWVAIPLIILRQIPVVLVMIASGYIISFWNIRGNDHKMQDNGYKDKNLNSFAVSFFPILATIIFAIALDIAGFSQLLPGMHVVIAIFLGIIILIAITKPTAKVLLKPLRGLGIYGVTLAAYGAFLLRETMVQPEISNVFSAITANGGASNIILLTGIPAVLGLLTGSPVSGVAISIPMLCGQPPIAPKVAAIIYASAYFGYTIAPTHLCFTFTVDYFKTTLGKVYKYVIPSFLLTFSTVLLVYFLL